MTEAITSKLSLVPKELIPTLSVGIVVIAAFLVIVFFALCVVYVNTRPPSVIKKSDKKPPEINKKAEPTKIRHEDLPIISGRLGEILTLSGLLKAGPITKIFFQVLEVLKNSTYDVRWRYNIPFFMLIGPDGSGKQTLLDSLLFERLTSTYPEINSMWKLFKNGAIFKFPKIDLAENLGTFWSFLSELFIFIRPRRPVDGIIVTIPMDMLLSTTHDIEKQATAIFERIFNFQKEINFRLPIYIMVTKSDLVSGFSEFAYLLKERTKQQIFGWSNPHTLNSAFSSSWISEIFSVINRGIRRATVVYASEKNIDTNLEKAILFESNFSKIENALSLYLNAMFRSHNPMDGLLLRGVYFIGKHKDISASSEIIQPSALSSENFNNIEIKESAIFNDELCFVQDVFSEKIFKEYNIAHPIRADVIDMTKKVFRNKLIFTSMAVIVTFGWFYGNYHIKCKIQEHYKVLRNVRTMLLKIQDIEHNMKGSDDQILLNKQAKNLLHNIPVIGMFDLFSPFVIQSWFSGLHKSITDTLGLVFDSVIVRAMYIDLNMNAKNMLEKYTEEYTDENSSEHKDIFDINSFTSFRKLKHFVEQISSIKRLSSEYNSIRKLEDRKSVIDLTTTLFKDKFEITEELKSHLPNKKLMPPQFDLGFYGENIEVALRQLFKEFMDEVFNGIIEKVLHNITVDIKKLESAAKMTNVEYATKDLAKIYQKTILFTDIMKNKHFDWITSKRFSPTNEYVELINTIHDSETTSEDFIRDILRTMEARFLKFKEKLRDFKTNLTQNIISDDFNKESEGFEALQKELKILLDQPFICVVPEVSFTKIIADDKMLLWDIRRLNELSNLIDSYYTFANNLSPDIRPQFFDMYKAIARKCFYPTAQSMLGNSQIFDDLPLGKSRDLLENAYKKQADNVRNATISIAKIAKFFDEICDQDTLKDCGFTSMIVSQYMELLEKIDNMFNLESPYSTGDRLFDDWKGEKNPKYLNIDDDVALKKYLTSQFKRIRFLAKDLAAPIVDLLAMPHVTEKIKDHELIEKWQEIISNVNDYEEKKPGNSLEALETFLSNTLKNVSMDSLDEHGDLKTLSESGGDFFSDKRADVAKALLSRADIVMYDKAAEKYRLIRRFFNNSLSHKFPFSKTSEDASLKDIEDFVNLYEENAKGITEILEKNKSRKQINAQIFEFLKSIDKTIPLLKAWIAHMKNSNLQSALFTFNVLTRPAASSEAFTSALLERELRIKGVLAADGEDITFFNGDSVKVIFTWVNNADEKPYEKDIPENLKIYGNSATFSYGGKWAMFRLIEQHKINKEVEFSNGILLEFDVPLLDKAKGNNLVTSKIVLKITPNMKVGDKSAPVIWPIFPEFCPDLHKNNISSDDD